MRFLLIDRITELEPKKSITAVKNLSLAEEYLADHFPGFPVMPGVLMLETLVQAGAWLIRHAENFFAHSTIMLKEARAIRYNSFVSPGNSLIVQMTVKKQVGNVWDFNGAGTVNGDSAVSAKLTLEAFNSQRPKPGGWPNRTRCERQTYRDLFSQIWTPAQKRGMQLGTWISLVVR